ncbi:MAG: hypothetical protein HIU89_15540 [Proteobacteria bacterium]|nr:hypothetical protein [Pseudomonadota bacterium]
MNVDHLLILYPDGRDKDPSGETSQSANALLAKRMAKIERLAKELAIKEGAQSKARTGSMMPAHVVQFDYLNDKLRFIAPKVENGQAQEKAQAKAQAKANEKALDNAASGAKSVQQAWKNDAKKSEKEGNSPQPPTWGVYLVVHGSGGEPSLRKKLAPENVAALIRNAEPKGTWRLKKVCIVGCTLGHVADQQTDSYVKKVCDELKWKGALVGGYTVQVFVADPSHIAITPSFAYTYGTPAMGLPENKGRKFVALPEEHPSRVKDTDGIERMTDEFRANYKVAWRWNGNASEKVDVMTEWYHQ